MSFSDEDWDSWLLEFNLDPSYLVTSQEPNNELQPRSLSSLVFNQTFDNLFAAPSPQVAGSILAQDEEAHTPAATMDLRISGSHVGGLSGASPVFGQIETPSTTTRTEKKRVATDNVIAAGVKRRKTIGRFTCELCNQTFTAQHNLRSGCPSATATVI
ncbi:hypothetical protein VNI00_004635 [Paramarasmius palmivorus]|uniref:C2H2-type domain-containing protein n=1 Tax=Paramarasmius palmivorus TaxID=297713 RepID=A0AAW0DFJ7_9AGAR